MSCRESDKLLRVKLQSEKGPFRLKVIEAYIDEQSVTEFRKLGWSLLKVMAGGKVSGIHEEVSWRKLTVLTKSYFSQFGSVCQ